MITSEIRAVTTQAFAAIDQGFRPRPELVAEIELAETWTRAVWSGVSLDLTVEQLKRIAKPGQVIALVPIDEGEDEKPTGFDSCGYFSTYRRTSRKT